MGKQRKSERETGGMKDLKRVEARGLGSTKHTANNPGGHKSQTNVHPGGDQDGKTAELIRCE